MFNTLIIQPIFNLLVLIYNLIPGHNFGLAIVVFTVLVRILLWPLVKKQLHHTKAIRALQPELKKIKLAAGGDKRKEQKLTMELYKEREINPLSTIGIAIAQMPILIGLYYGLQKIIQDPNQILSFSYPALHFGWLNTLSHNIHQFDNTLFGVVDLGRKAISPQGTYWPAVVIVVLSALVQYVQSKQLMPAPKDSRGLRSILKEAGAGQQADQQEVQAAVGRGTLILIPFVLVVVGLHFAVALPLYWLTSSLVALVQQSKVLSEDFEEAETLMDAPVTIDSQPIRKNKKSSKKSSKKRKRR